MILEEKKKFRSVRNDLNVNSYSIEVKLAAVEISEINFDSKLNNFIIKTDGLAFTNNIVSYEDFTEYVQLLDDIYDRLLIDNNINSIMFDWNRG